MKNFSLKTMKKTTKNHFITYAMVIIVFAVVQFMVNGGMMSICAAVDALPHLNVLADKHPAALYVCEQLFIALFVLLFNLGNALEHYGYRVEALFPCNPCKFGIHLRPLVVFAARCRNEVGLCVAYALEELEPHFCVLLFVVGGLFKNGGYLVVALFFCHRGKECVFVAGFAFA